LPFEERLLRTLSHPVQEQRLLAIRILGDLGSQSALPFFERLLIDPNADVYELQEILNALNKIQGIQAQKLIRSACDHPFKVVRHLAKKLSV